MYVCKNKSQFNLSWIIFFIKIPLHTFPHLLSVRACCRLSRTRGVLCLQDDECKVRAPHSVSGVGPQDGDASRLDIPSTHQTRNVRPPIRHSPRQVVLHAHVYVSPACYQPLNLSTPRIITLSYLCTVYSILQLHCNKISEVIKRAFI